MRSDALHAIEHDGEPLTIVEATKWFRRTVDGLEFLANRYREWRYSTAL